MENKKKKGLENEEVLNDDTSKKDLSFFSEEQETQGEFVVEIKNSEEKSGENSEGNIEESNENNENSEDSDYNEKNEFENENNDKNENEIVAEKRSLNYKKVHKLKNMKRLYNKPPEVLGDLSLRDQIEESAEEARRIEKENLNEINPTDEEIVLEAEKEVKKNTSTYLRYFYLICLGINFAVFAAFLLVTSRSKMPFEKLFSTAESKTWIIAAVACFFVGMGFETFRIYILVKKSTRKRRPFTSYKSVAISKYYDFITPLGAGGQAHQVSYLYKNGIARTTASSVPLTKYVFSKLSYILFVVFVLLLGNMGFYVNNFAVGFVSVFAYIGLAVHLFLAALVIIFGVSRTIAPGFTIGILKLAKKLRIIKNYKEVYVKVLRVVHDFQLIMRKFMGDATMFVFMLLSSLAVVLVRCLIPVFIYFAFFGYAENQILPLVARMVICDLATGLWIMPGNVVVADVVFWVIFKDMFKHGTMFWAILFFRLLSYYAYIIQGFLVMLYEKIKYDLLKKTRAHTVVSESESNK